MSFARATEPNERRLSATRFMRTGGGVARGAWLRHRSSFVGLAFASDLPSLRNSPGPPRHASACSNRNPQPTPRSVHLPPTIDLHRGHLVALAALPHEDAHAPIHLFPSREDRSTWFPATSCSQPDGGRVWKFRRTASVRGAEVTNGGMRCLVSVRTGGGVARGARRVPQRGLTARKREDVERAAVSEPGPPRHASARLHESRGAELPFFRQETACPSGMRSRSPLTPCSRAQCAQQ